MEYKGSKVNKVKAHKPKGIKVDEVKLMKYKASRLKGLKKAQSLRNAGYSEAVASHRQADTTLAIVGDNEILQEEKVTQASIHKEYNSAKTRAIKKGDITNEVRIIDGKRSLYGVGKEQGSTNIYNLSIDGKVDPELLTRLARRKS